jgi:DNA invertase Pin-like site-specific DNA recombinase
MATKHSENKVKTSAFSYLRWSSQPQIWGDSERRQLQAAEARCRQRGLTLSDRFEDRGVSAWNGKNQERALGDLLRIAKRGDYLLVEDADRLSRRDWLTAQNFVAGIAAKGVTIVTLNDNKEINAERLRLDPGFRG